MLTFFIIGFALGAGTGLPIGAVGLAVVDAACRRPLAKAIGIGLGGGVGDLLFSAVGILGMGTLIATSPVVPAVLYLTSGLTLMVFGAWHLLRRTTPAQRERTAGRPSTTDDLAAGGVSAGFVVGFAMVTVNPASLVTWTVIVAGLMQDTSRAAGICTALGIGFGSFSWFAFLALMARKGAALRADRMRLLVRCTGGLIVGYGVYSLSRGAGYWLH